MNPEEADGDERKTTRKLVYLQGIKKCVPISIRSQSEESQKQYFKFYCRKMIIGKKLQVSKGECRRKDGSLAVEVDLGNRKSDMFLLRPYTGNWDEDFANLDAEEADKRRREEIERRIRRGDVDARLEFLIQMVMEATGLHRHKVLDFVFEADMMDEMEKLFHSHMRSKLMWFYQDVVDVEATQLAEAKPSTSKQMQPSTSRQVTLPPISKKKLFLTDGWQIPLNGLCIYAVRTSTSKPLPEDGFQKDLYCGIIDSRHIGMITTMERLVEIIFMAALQFPSVDCEDETQRCPLVKNQLVPSLRSFISVLKVCEEVAKNKNPFDDGHAVMCNITFPELKEASKYSDKVHFLERRVKIWCKRLDEVLKESEQIRRETDTSGPQDELEYWKKRSAHFCQIIDQVNSREVQMTILCLKVANSRMVPLWKSTDKKITFCYNESKDNAKFIQTMETKSHALYLEDPMKMQNCIWGLLQTIRLIYTVSQYYNTSERASALMIKITNQMIANCKSYITCRNQESIWSQNREEVRKKLIQCIQLNKTYRKIYSVIRDQPTIPGQNQLNFSEHYIFGKFDNFSKRLRRIVGIFDHIYTFAGLFHRRMEGLLLGDALEDSLNQFEKIKAEIVNKPYNYLDQRNTEFDEDYSFFISSLKMLKEHIAIIIEKNFESVWETPQGFKFLARFEKTTKHIPLTRIEEKYDILLKYCHSEVDKIIRQFRRQKDDPPVPRMFPPIAGRIKWAKCLLGHLNEIWDNISSHEIMKNLPLAQEIARRHKAGETMLKAYETDMVGLWMSIKVTEIDPCLLKKLITVCSEQEKLKVNFHSNIRLLIREAGLMIKMDLPVPTVALVLFAKQDDLSLEADCLQFMINDFLAVVKSVKSEVRPLLLRHLIGLIKVIEPGMHTLNWVSPEWKKYVDKCNEAINTFQMLVNRVHDIYVNRIIETLNSMQKIELHLLPGPDEKPWTLKQFQETIEGVCGKGAVELNKRTLMVEEAVEEILELARKCNINSSESVDEAAELIVEEIDDDDARSDVTQHLTDWSLVQDCFEKPHILLSGGMTETMSDIVRSALSEIRSYYKRKVIDVLVRVTKNSLDVIRKRFVLDFAEKRAPVFILQASLLIPKVKVQPNLEEVQDTLNLIGKTIMSVSKGVSEWIGRNGTVAPKSQWKKFTGRNVNLANIVHRSQTVHLKQPTCSYKKAGTKNKDDELREKRRRLYRLYTTNKDLFPIQQKNVYNRVVVNKEIVKMWTVLTMCTVDMETEMDAFLNSWYPYSYLWKTEKSARDLLNCSLAEFEEYLRKYDELNELLTSEPNVFVIANCLAIDTNNLKFGILTEIKSCTYRIAQAMKKKYKREMDFMYIIINEMGRTLERPIKDLDDVRMTMDNLKKIRDQEVDMELKIVPVEEAFNVLNKYEIKVEIETMEQVENLRKTWGQLLARALNVQVNLLEMQPKLQDDLAQNLEQFRQDKMDYCNEYKTAGPMQSGLSPREASDRLLLFQNRFDGMWRKLQTFQSGEELFGLPITDYPELAQIKKELNLLQKLYKLYNDVIDRVTSYYEISWEKVNIEEINNELMEFQNRCRKLPKGLKEWPAFFALKKTIDDFNDMCPLLELMANRAMKPRHWQKITEVLQHNFDLEVESFCLKDILEAPLLKNKEYIEDVCISAIKERDIEGKLRQVTNEWTIHELTFMTFNNRGELLLRGDTTAETISQLEDSLMILGSLLSNRYNAPFRSKIQQWACDLSNTNEILERWLLVQNMWVYLEAVFVGGDIARQLPKEAKRFSKIDKSWQKIMHKAHENRCVVPCCIGDDTLKHLLPHLQEQLELCQKSLSGYLEKKRMMFPRFFFVSDPALLEILGQASDSHTIQNHLLSIFDNTKSVKFHDFEYDKIMAIVSSEGETIQLEGKGVRAEGSVEIWLTQLLQTSQATIHSIIRQAHAMINDVNFSLLGFLDKISAQVGLLGIQMIWTRDSEFALIHAKYDKTLMPNVNTKFLELLNTLIEQTTRDLSQIERTKFETLITIHVHQRDIFDNLCRINVRSANDFEWLKQCRFYFKEDWDKTEINITDVHFTYQNEYLGCTERLVITPLTDRCYITLAQALAMSMGGSPCGPAGTGKTETVKDMAKTLGKYVIVFNCSDQMDYKGLGRIFKGLAQSGSWGCFDEFNRIDLPVLSVAAQQIAVVLSSKKDKRKTFQFTDGDVVDLCPEFGIFITMNPTYTGRKVLPENLKIQFRTVAMMVPDRQIIIRVKLASCGFLENITLARKFYTLYKLCEEQLTKQVHYDFGLRNILSVLRSLGSAKRVNNKDPESVIVMRVLRDMNLSKLIDEDEPLFMSLIGDLFPNQVLEKTGYAELEEAINQQVEQAGLVNHASWQLKLIQLYETQQVRHGIMILGHPGAGKTSCIHILMKSLTKMGYPHREMRMNPKAITSAQMFGRLDVATNDWTDGIFAALWRKTLKMKSTDHVWLVLDGPVDSIWIENLNSVLDDNKTLTLANGDRLPMAPKCKIVFEPENIDNASPATVSRNGMVYMSASGLNWKPLLKAWLKKRSKKEQEVFEKLFEETFPELYNWGKHNFTLVVEVLQCNIVFQMIKLLEGLIPLEETVKDITPVEKLHKDKEEQEKETLKAFSAKHLGKFYVFSLIWGFGAILEIEDRMKFDTFLKEKCSTLDLPNNVVFSDTTVFDFVVNPEGNWVPWTSMLTNYVYPELATPEFTTILIPIQDNVRINFLINLVAKQGKGVLLLGEQGTGKTVMMKSFMKQLNNESYLNRAFNFSSATSPYQFQKTIESYIEKRMGNTFGAPNAKKLMVFIDDINLPEINTWGDQITNEIVRQTMDMGGFYSLEKPGEFISIVDIQFLAAMGQPGGGTNDIPSRLKRHFCIFNCPLPSDVSIDKIFGTIAAGYYNVKRGFTHEVRNIVKKLIPLTRILWKNTRAKLLPTPAKFHYVFSLRELSRIWQGMVGTLSTVIESEEVLMLLWKHECCRVFSDRFTVQEDKDWFNSELFRLVEKYLGNEIKAKCKLEPVFVDFMRDAPEPTGEEGEEADMELPKVYEPVMDEKELRERLEMFLSQFNEMVRGSGMDLVFFPDAMLHLVKISRVIRHPRGNVMLVGVGGSGKQSLTKLSSFIAGYKTFQITLTRSYNTANFLEDLKVLYRSCGCQGKSTTFIFSDLDIKEEGFLEYLNNNISSGVISHLFTKDEQLEIMQELTPIMKRENPKRAINYETVMEFFINKTSQNLHIVFCFSPVGEKFRRRALRFPALMSGCTIDWFQPWPKDALTLVSKHFLTDFQIACSNEIKQELVSALASIQDTVSKKSMEYFQRFRRSTHVTPKSYLNFIAGYKSVYNRKQKELNEGALRMETGLKRLAEASSSVLVLKKDLAEMEKDLVNASEVAERVLIEVTDRARQAEEVKNQLQKVKEKAEVIVLSIAEEKALAEQKLEAAKPALEEAEAALNTIKPAHIATVRKLGRPPHLIMRIMDCVLILFQRKIHPVVPDSVGPCPKPSWPESLKMMASTTFLLQLQNYPKDSINDEMVDLLEPYFQIEDYNMGTARRVCGDVAGLLSWTKAMTFFHSVNKEVMPLKINLAMHEARLKVAMEDLAAAESQLEEREQSLRQVKEQYDNAVREKQRLTEAANSCLRKMNIATTLINSLAGEKVRWTYQSREFKEQLGRLVGDALLATGFLSYSGPYNQEYRASILNIWKDILQARGIPYTADINIVNMLVDSASVSDWNLQGLPNDELSIQNALIVTKARSYPLLIDPQNQGKMWIKNREANNNLKIITLNNKYFRTHLEDCLSLGKPLLIEDVDEELDPLLDNVLDKNFIKSGTIRKLMVGDKECDVLTGFMLYITTKLPNPSFSPEISAKTSIIDFTVTTQGLEDQLLGRVILMEKSELEAERVALFESVVENQKKTKDLEANLLYKLNQIQGSLVDDEELINVLQTTKMTAEEVTKKLQVSAQTEKKITTAREEYRAVAARGSILYFLIVEMSNVNPMYHNSLKQFLNIFDNSILKSEKTSNTADRISIILRDLTFELWTFIQRSLYESHKMLFTLMMAMKIDLKREYISHDEFMSFIKGGASLDLNAVKPKPFRWILDITWLNLVEINKLPEFSEILSKVEHNEREWKHWYEQENLEEEDIPCGYQKALDVFRKLLLIRSWSPDRTLSQARKYIISSLGEEYDEPVILDLESTWKESDPRTPLICLLSIGSDPSPQITFLAKYHEIGCPIIYRRSIFNNAVKYRDKRDLSRLFQGRLVIFRKPCYFKVKMWYFQLERTKNDFPGLKSVSMGQGQEIVAKDIIEYSMANGGWVLLQNIHLSLFFANEVMTMLIDAPQINDFFRIWLTSEVHPQFPIGLLQMSIKFTNEPPQGIKASLKRTYQNISQDFLDYSPQPQWPVLLYGVAFLHTVIQERRKFGPLGWNVPYEFNQADFAASVQFIQNHLDDIDPKKGVSWPTICYMLGEVQYGGRVTDDFDKRLLNTFTQVWFCDGLLRPGFQFFKNYKVPQTRSIYGFMDNIHQLPSTDSPEVFGLHCNADITYQINAAKAILDTILSVQPKEGAFQGGETRESVVYCLAEDMLTKIPPLYNAYDVKEALQRMGALQPMNIFLRQEIDRIQKVLKEVKSTLVNLKLAIDGTIVMSENLRTSLDAMYDARIPEKWQKISWESVNLGFWYTELLERDSQFRYWCNKGRPTVFWMTGFFNPQGFLTAMRQDVTRAHKGWALDCVVLQNMITRYQKDDIKEGPAEGVYVHGLFLEGAGLDRRTGKLIESKPKVLYEQMPVIYIFAINSTSGKSPKLYECPIYRKPQRTDQMYVGSIDFETDHYPRHWTLRGVALLCDIR